jgi:excinuclease UvrABC helicase subunit UvrB
MLGLETKEKDVKNLLTLEMQAEGRSIPAIIAQKTKEMKAAAKKLQFELAGLLRDEIAVLDKELKKQEKKAASPLQEAKKRAARLRPRHGKTR